MGKPKPVRTRPSVYPDTGDREPADWQERHSPTKAVMLQIDRTRTRQQGRRRTSDARMWEAMSPRQESAADAIGAAVALVSGEVGIRTQPFQRLGRGPSRPDDAKADRQAVLVQRYRHWCERAGETGINVSDVLQILVHGESCHQQDRRTRRRNGTALGHLIEALELYAVLQGWG